MNMRVVFMSLLCAFVVCHAKGQRLEPFVKGGLTIGLFDDSPPLREKDVGHTGFNLGAGVKIPLSKPRKTMLVSALTLISKGDTYDVSYAGGRVSFNLLYLETQLDFIFRLELANDWCIPIGTGLYGSYGIDSKVSATNGIKWFRGIPVGECPSMFSSVVGANRWDAGWRICTFGVERHRFMFQCDVEFGFFSQIRSSKSNPGVKNGFRNNVAVSMNFGYCF